MNGSWVHWRGAGRSCGWHDGSPSGRRFRYRWLRAPATTSHCCHSLVRSGWSREAGLIDAVRLDEIEVDLDTDRGAVPDRHGAVLRQRKTGFCDPACELALAHIELDEARARQRG